MPKKDKGASKEWFQPQSQERCALCSRVVPQSQRDEHHMVPKLKGGTETKVMHRICHRQIHAIFSEAELSKRYNTIEALLEHEEIRKFVAWVSKKPDDFIERVKKRSAQR